MNERFLIEKHPLFNGVTPLPMPERAAIRQHMANWLAIHARIKVIESTMTAPECLAHMQRMLLVELTDHVARPRWHIIDRLYTRVAKWRKRRERYDIRQWLDSNAKAE